MLTAGDIVELDLGAPAVVVTAQQILRCGPNVIQVVPVTRTIRDSSSEIVIEPDGLNGLVTVSAAQCQHIRSVATTRVCARIGNVGPVVLRQLRHAVAVIIDA